MTKVKTVCAGKVDTWTSRKKALAFFMEGVCACDPNSSEGGRYLNIYLDLQAGSPVGWDGMDFPGIPEIEERNAWFSAQED